MSETRGWCDCHEGLHTFRNDPDPCIGWRERNTRHDFRIIRGEGGDYREHYYSTREQRNEAAQRFADMDGTNVLTELWAADLSQDDLNQGWGCDGHRTPTTTEEAPHGQG